MKRLLFDLDNTLIKWRDDYTSALQKTIKEFNIDVDYHIIDNIIEQQEKIHETMSKEVLLNDINNAIDIKLDISFINRLLENQKQLADIDDDVIETLDYLSKKYELYILTNYFKESQWGRLKTAKINKYFKGIFSGDEMPMKPRLEAFQKGIGNLDKKDVMMIGDSYDCDISGALNAGLKVIQVDYYNKYEDNNEYPIARKFSDLKKYL